MDSIRYRGRRQLEHTPSEIPPGKIANQRAWKWGQLSLLILIFRLVNALTTKTFFQADEYFQLLEPAHNYVFGYGYMTWEWGERLRSSIHPFVFVLGYKLVQLLQLSPQWEAQLVYLAPKFIGAIIATISELCLYFFVDKYTQGNTRLSRITLIVSLTNPFNWFLITRSFSNNFEMMLTTVALSLWPWHQFVYKKAEQGSKKHSVCSFIVALAPFYFGVLSCIVRPTNSILWLCIGIWTVSNRIGLNAKLYIVALAIVSATIALIQSTYLDYLFYSEWTFPLYNFLEFNLIKNLSIFYGVAPWHFYIFQAVPMMTLTYLPFLLHRIVVEIKSNQLNILTSTGLIVITGFSLIDHKEIRFIYPLMPIISFTIAQSVYSILIKYEEKDYGKDRDKIDNGSKIPYKKQNNFIFRIKAAIFVVNVGLAVFFTQIHERGVIDVVKYLREDPEITSFGFLTPCHSTPWQSSIHSTELNESGWFLTCEPPLNAHDYNLFNDKTSIIGYRDESDQFYDDMDSFIDLHFPSLSLKGSKSSHNGKNKISTSESSEPGDETSNGKIRNVGTKSKSVPHIETTNRKYDWPSRIIIFEPLETYLDTKLAGKYYQCRRFFNSYFHWDSRRSGDVIVYCLV